MNRILKSALALLLTLCMILPLAVPAYAEGTVLPGETGVTIRDPDSYPADKQAAAEELRSQMEKRQPSIEIKFQTSEDLGKVLNEIFELALAHTGVPTQGDYLKWQIGTVEYGFSGMEVSGVCYGKLIFHVNYYTNAQQEAALDQAVDSLLRQLNVYKADDYTKVSAIYDYMCSNIVYDTEGLLDETDDLKFTAYAALIKKTSVCQGYANLFYRLALELGVDTRLITGIGNGGGHAWNIVRLDGKYYNLDATWDAPLAAMGREYQHFLECNADFSDHYRDAAYTTAAFEKSYPMAKENYVYVEKEAIPGDMNSDSKLTDADAIYLLRHTMIPSRYPVPGDADVNGDGNINDADAIYLLRHIMIPTRYPLYPSR